ncbi:hypothetical protein ELH91_07885 [Rhizobium leguminosarum]|uniref:hypothetical protein n=1 Tax=Rhizobium leguminosarum TaxID=384 RepID=UPI001031D531|nr:hypothetical protein [Rhizobium leguminosarum]TAY16700.1 hypothetical protein ELH91_07885 [Rhizobium leguminosarum]
MSKLSLLVLALLLPGTVAFGAETSASDYLNGVLATKPAITGRKTVTTQKERCFHHRLPRVADGGDWVECHKDDVVSVVPTPILATVTSSWVERVDQFKLDTAHVTSLPSQPLLYRQTYKNCGEGTTLSNSVTLSVTGTEGFQVQKTKTVATTRGGTFTMTGQYAALPGGIGGSASAQFNMSSTVTTSNATTESSSKSVTRTQTWSVTIPPQTMGYLGMLAYQETVDIPYSAVVVVDGDIVTNDSGIAKSSDLLTPQERTLPFEGVLHLTNVSNGEFETQPFPGSPKCSDAEKGFLLLSGEQIPLPSGVKFEGGFLNASEFHKLQTNANAINATPQGKMQILVQGNPDEFREQVFYHMDVVRRAPECGFDASGEAKLGVFSAEGRWFSRNIADADLQSSDLIYKFKECQK